ncbi:MAG: peptidylprolyl isomerase [Planctomycetales bacterium]|nr:peptidylprolyl isomerase [Planctomycetales bacterium]
MLAGDCAFTHNSLQPLDVNRDSFVSPIDALISINYQIQSSGDDASCPPEHFALDVNNDGQLSPIDTVRIINRLATNDDDRRAEGAPGDIEISIGESTFVIYNSETGEVSVESEVPIRIVQLISESGIFDTSNVLNLGGDFDISQPNEITKVAIEAPFFQQVSFGNVAPIGLSAEFLADDLNIEGAPAEGGILTSDWINIGVEFRDDVGRRIDSVTVGDTFHVMLTVEDHRPGPIDFPEGGVFSAHVDAYFEPKLAAVAGEFESSENYPIFHEPEHGAGFIEDVGATASSIAQLGRGKFELVRWTMTAVTAGDFRLIVDDAGNSPATDMLLYGVNAPIDPALVEYDDGSVLEILPGDGGEQTTDTIRIPIGGDKNLVYEPSTGELGVESPTMDIPAMEIFSQGGHFIVDAAINLQGDFDIIRPDKIAKIVPLDPFFGDVSFGLVLPPGLTEEFLATDISVNGARLNQGTLTSEWIRVDTRFESVDGDPIESISIGGEFDIVFEVTSQEPGPVDERAAVVSAFVDATFEGNATVELNFTPIDSEFDLIHSAIRTNEIDELGGTFLGSESTIDRPQVLARYRATAETAGEFSLSVQHSDTAGNAFRFSDSGDPISPLLIDFSDSPTLTIQSSNEPAADLVAFAQALADSGAIFYGAAWSAQATRQKQMFQDGARYLPFVEVTNADRSLNAVGEENEITVFPTWKFANGARGEGVLSLAQISEHSGVPIPMGVTPHIATPKSEPVVVEALSPMHIPLDGYDPNGGRITYSVTSDDSSIASVELRDTERSVRISVHDFGDMVFQLFDEEVPRVTEQITSLAESGFYKGVIFHRIIDDFVIQGGDPTGTGAGGSHLPDFDDQFDVDLRHNRDGILSMAKAQDDTNNSQFFITDVPTPHLDFNHSIFGQLVEGDAVRDAINAVETDLRDRPTFDVVMETVSVFDDPENALLRITANAESGSTMIHVTAEDDAGNTTTMSFAVTVGRSLHNALPFLLDIPAPVIENDRIVVDLDAIDVDGDPFEFSAVVVAGNVQIDVNPETGRISMPRRSDGIATIQATVRPTGGAIGADDTQEFTINFADFGGPELEIDLLADSDSGSSDLDNVTNANNLSFQLSFDSGSEVAVVDQHANVVILYSVPAGETEFTVDASSLADGTYSVTLNGDDALSVTIDRTPPVRIDEDLAISATVGVLYVDDLQHPDEGQAGFSYSFDNVDSAFTIDARTGVITGRPLLASDEPATGEVQFTDAAGNSTSQQITASVSQNSKFELDVLAFAEHAGAGFFFDPAGGIPDFLKELTETEFLENVPQGTDPPAEIGADAFPAIELNGSVLTNIVSIQQVAEFLGLIQPGPTQLADVVVPTRGVQYVPLGIVEDVTFEVQSDESVDLSATSTMALFNPVFTLEVAGYGTMSFEIFEAFVPGLAKHLEELVNSGHYDGLEFYRVNDDLAQAGDPNKLALSASDSASHDDEFHWQLRHAGPGVLSMAKLVDDGNGDNFFITSRAMPEFDFHYSIVGHIVEGEGVRSAIADAQAGVGGMPMDPIVITSATFDRSRHGATLIINGGATEGEATITGIRDGQEFTVDVTVEGEVPNSPAFMSSPGTVGNTGIAGLRAIDLDGDEIEYRIDVASVTDDAEVEVEFTPDRVIVVHSPAGFVGTVELDVAISSVGGAVQLDGYDRQRLSIHVSQDANDDGQVDMSDVDFKCRAYSVSGLNFEGQLDFFGLTMGDVNFDGVFDSGDLVLLFKAAQYEDGELLNSVWSTGDFNCDQEFDSSDLVAAFEANTYVTD